MLFRRYNTDVRNRIVICSDENEDLNTKNINNKRDLLTIFNRKYEKKILDSIPYNYFVLDREIVKVKEDDLAHNDNSFLESFNDDIKILLISDTYLADMADELSTLIAQISAEYSLSIKDRVEFIKVTKSISEIDIINNIVISAIKKRHKLKPEMSIMEFVCGNNIITNDSIVCTHNRDGYSSLDIFASKYSVPVEILIDLNPHVKKDALKYTDTIFIPNTVSINGRIIARNISKETEYSYKNCEEKIKKGVGLDG